LGKENKYPLALSGGEQQHIGIARAVVNKPALILADEPTGNLDPQLSAEIMRLFEQFKQVGVTVLVATHDIELVTKLDHRVLQLDHCCCSPPDKAKGYLFSLPNKPTLSSAARTRLATSCRPTPAEPTGNLDPQLSAEIMRLFEQFKQVGVTYFFLRPSAPSKKPFRLDQDES
jgi:ABC-type ATPase involved in cell division